MNNKHKRNNARKNKRIKCMHGLPPIGGGNYKKIVILLGAGAVVPWGGTQSKDINELFAKDETYKTKDGVPFGKYIFEVLNDFYGNDCSNFETVIAVLYDISLYIMDKTNGGKNVSNTSINPAFFNLKDEEKLKELASAYKDNFGRDDITKERAYCFELFRHYINLVIKEIDNYNKKVNSNEILNRKLIDFVEYFRNKKYAMKFYTTNYDNLIPQILSKQYKVYQGFNKNSKNNDLESKTFNFDLNAFRTAQLTHFNLHGSIFLEHKFSCQKCKYETNYAFVPQKLVYALIENGGNPNHREIFTPIITGYNKTQRIVNKPFNLGFSAFINDLNDCDGLITVGYSFSDPHINSLLSSFTNWDKTKFVCITKCNKVCDGCDEQERCMSFENFEEYFFTNDKVDDNGWVHDEKSRKHLYKKGFSNFLDDKSNWGVILK